MPCISAVNERYKNISFFEGLNALRFFAALLVVLHHAETLRKDNGLSNLESFGLFRNGGNAVTFFFVLSGFLITYLLLKEDGRSGAISIKGFYMRRVLRIWPLYFLLVVIGTIAMPLFVHIFHIDYQMPYTLGQVWYYFVFFLPGLASFYFGNNVLEPLWSIGVEEVFYLFWAPLFKKARKMILPILVGIIVLKLALMFIAAYYSENELFNYLVRTFRFEAMAIGGLGAYFVYHRQKPLSELVIYKKAFQTLIYGLLATFLMFGNNLNLFILRIFFNNTITSNLLLDALFLYLIIGVSLIGHNIFKLQSKWLSDLGEISYGIYMYHLLVVLGVVFLLKKYLSHADMITGSVVYYLTLLSAVLFLSFISKKYFEDYFLALKHKLGMKSKGS
jgi:peptidoglycan/LPS O-acetylase OafA/YrhL